MQEKPEADEGPFSKEERDLIDAIAERLGRVIERRQAEEALRRSQRELAIRNKIADVFLTIPDEEMYGEALQVVLEALESRHGVFGYIDENGAIVRASMTRDVWDQCRVPDKDIVCPPEQWGGIWGRALTEKKSLYSNEPGRVPEGHIPVLNSLAVPIIHRKRVIGLLHVANKETDYDENDRRLLETIAGSIAPILRARLQRDRQERRRRLAEEKLKRHRDRLEELVDERTADLTQTNERLLREAEERRQAEEALWQSEERFSKAFRNAPLPIAISNSQDGRLIDVNDSFLRLIGYRREEVIGRTTLELGLWVDPEERGVLVKTVREEGMVRDFGHMIRTKSGEIRHVLNSMVEIELGGGPRLLTMAADITERKRAEEALRESEERFRTLSASAPLGILLLDAEGRAVYANERAQSITGLPLDQLLGTGWMSAVHPDDRDALLAERSKAIAERRDFTWEFRMLTPQGMTRWTRAHSAPLFSADGEHMGRVGTIEDITEHRQAEEALRDSETRYRELFSGINSGVAVYEACSDGEDFVFRDFNQAGERIESTQKDVLLGRRVTEVFPGIREFGLLDVFRRVWRTGTPEHHPVSIYRDNRIAGWRENYVYKLPSGEIVALYEEVTERKQAEEALRESEERFRTLSASAPIGIMLVDNKDGLVYCNERLLAIYGLPLEEILGFGWVKYVHPDDREAFLAERSEAMAEGREFVREFRIVTPQGVTRWVRARTTTVSSQEGMSNTRVGTVEDITEHRQAEEQARQLHAEQVRANELRRMVRILEQMAATLGHELRNPLGVINNSVYFLANQAQIDDPKAQKHVEIISHEVASARRVIDDILEFAHVPQLLPAAASINAVVDSALARSQIPANIRVVRGLAVDLSPLVCDEERLERAFIDVIANAVQAMPHGGRLGVKTCRSGDDIEVVFSDSGVGVAPENLDKVFEPMFTTKLRGIGLGLKVVRRTVEQHGGEISVRSRLGRGAIFRITLPRDCRPLDAKGGRVA